MLSAPPHCMQVRSLVLGKERLVAGDSFVAPPPLFVVASTADEVQTLIAC